jgi:hypothetical protein
MLRRRIRSALYIDFENVPLPPEAIGNWLAWLEDGIFDPTGARRRFLQKRVYWNSHAERNRGLFERHGFAPILIGKYSGLKNGADIRMAMDVVETTYMRSDIDEFFLLTGDSDFVPVIERLKEKAKRSAIVATEHRPNIHTTYHRNADLLIPSRRLTEAAQYRREPQGYWARFLGAKSTPERVTEKAPQGTPTNGGSSQRHGAPGKPQMAAPVREPAAPPPPALETAAGRVAKLLTQQPRNYVSQKRVLAELDRVQSFKRQGPNAYLGTGSYKALLRELSRLEPRITVVDQPGGGTGVVFIPPLPPGALPEALPSSSSQGPEQQDTAPATERAPSPPAMVNGSRREPEAGTVGLVVAHSEITGPETEPALATSTDEPDANPSAPERDDERPDTRIVRVAGESQSSHG